MNLTICGITRSVGHISLSEGDHRCFYREFLFLNNTRYYRVMYPVCNIRCDLHTNESALRISDPYPNSINLPLERL